MGLFVAGKLFHKAGEGSGGGSDPHNKGWYATLSALQEAYPTAEAGDWAIVGATDTVWIWDDDNSEWVDSDQKGQVTSVNGQTGAVTVQETLVSGTNIKTINGSSVLGSGDLTISGFVPQYATMPTASASYAGTMAQYAGESTEDYECGWFYFCDIYYDNATATISQTTGSGLSDLTVDAYTFAEYESASTDETVNFVWSDSDSSWTKGGETVDITDYGITYSGTPTDGDVLTVVLTMGYAWANYWVQEWPIDDGSTAEDKTWSANKLNTMIGDIETLLSQI